MSTPNSVTELLQALIRIPSVNPFALDDDSALHLGEARCAQYIADFLARLGAEVTVEEIEPNRPNVIGRFPSRGAGKPRVLLAPHIDTVTIKGMTIDPFAAEIWEGKVYGRGASDTKGTMAAMLWALRELGSSRLADLAVEVTFAGFMGEENSQPGSKHFAQNHPDYAFAVVGEPTGLDVVYTHKGTTWAELVARGRSAHGSRPEIGDNAILKLTRALDQLDRNFPPAMRAFADPVLGLPTMNIGQLEGGSQPNIVPDRAVASCDFRLTPALAEHGFLELLRQHLPEEITVVPRLECQPLATDPEHPMIAALAEAGSGRKVGAPWFCDAAHLAAAGIPSVAAGPGSIDQAHTDDEWIAIDDLEKGVNFYRAFLETC